MICILKLFEFQNSNILLFQNLCGENMHDTYSQRKYLCRICISLPNLSQIGFSLRSYYIFSLSQIYKEVLFPN